MKKHVLFTLYLFLSPVLFLQASGFKLIENNKGANLFYGGNEQVVLTAIEMLIGDSRLVCDTPLVRHTQVESSSIWVGIPEKEADFKQLLIQYQVDYSDIRDQWEAFKIQKVEASGKSILFVIGSDPRGTAYGVLELSRKMGISPWVWWADVTPVKRTEVVVSEESTVQFPFVQYRGIFLNDEDWGLMPWSSRTYEPTPVKGEIGPRTYARICELLLRLRANTLWPAMHECTVPFYFTEGNKETADRYGIIMGTSHCEPLMRTNTGEWDSRKYGAYNFQTNRAKVLSYWEERLKEVAQTENIYTLGMRGVHDGRMEGVQTIEDEAKILQEVITAQRKLLTRHHPDLIAQIPQVFIPYKEVLKAYDNGLDLPDDVTLVWCDDNHGYLTRLSSPQEQKRTGGSGVYYHVSYWGKPHDYLWLATTPPGLIYREMQRAWDQGARRIWILNVGDIKPAEYLTEFFLDMAWNIGSFSGENLGTHLQDWAESVFGGVASDTISGLLQTYYQLASHRKPEHMGWNRVEEWSSGYARGLTPIQDTEFSPFYFGDEISERIRAYRQIERQSAELYENRIPASLRPAFFQLVHYPIAASAAQNRKLLYAQKARLYARYGLPVSEEYAQMSTSSYHEIAALDYTYNKDMLRGKWELMMDMKPRDLPVFQAAPLSIPAALEEEAENDFVVWVENSSSPISGKTLMLPSFSGKKEESYFVIFHPKTKVPVHWAIRDLPEGMVVKESGEGLQYEKKLVFSLSDHAPSNGHFTLQVNESSYTVSYRADRPLKEVDRYTETNQMIALNAHEYTHSASFEFISGLGHSGKAVRLPAAGRISSDAPHLEYKITTHHTGKIRIKTGTIPSHPVGNNELQYALVVDAMEPQIVSTRADFLTPVWAENVLRNQSLTTTEVWLTEPGLHTIRLYALDEELIVDQIMIECNPERKHYLIPSTK